MEQLDLTDFVLSGVASSGVRFVWLAGVGA